MELLKYEQQQKPNGSYVFLETAGGIHSPVMSGKQFKLFFFFFALKLKFISYFFFWGEVQAHPK